ncbi:MAG: phage terminase small subunit P27 family [Brevundimonas sp.]|uniref:phage terminase small subunit P27 family n=1 Tax=Brevundimonas sp. TaxID=1871086 RepID=UPI001200A767|nr:phage terminase small subunit P27 family [Brevundimonas sp.]RZJ19113.1 MAG: phage terminase small subunit P27 family [Brevundimonas sp.]
MARGRKPDPASVKVAKGNPSRRRIGVDPVVQPARPGAVQPPTWLKGDGLKVWDRLSPRLELLKLLTPVDAEAFGRYCRNFARWLKMQERLDTEGEIYEIVTASGTVRRPDPAYMIGDRLERQLISAEDRFGLNPAERQRLFASRATTPDPAGDLFGSRPEPGSSKTDEAEAPARTIGLLN